MEIDLPSSLDDALDALDADPQATLLAGGTDLMVDVNFGRARPQHVIALRRVDDLRSWEGSFLGAGVTYGRMERGPIRALGELARTVGSPQIRNAGTLGGNLGTCSPAGDALPFLAALDAGIQLASRAGGTRSLPFDEFMIGPKQNARRPDEIILGVTLPERIPERQAFGKIGIRQAMVIATVSACVFRDEEGTTRVGVGSAGPVIIRPREAEELISAEPDPSEAALAEFARLVAAAVRPITDHRATAAYRRHASGVLARRLLERCLA
jgi:CO/xanthine dehydrogenase FAD-binding subunit